MEAAFNQRMTDMALRTSWESARVDARTAVWHVTN